MKLFLKNIGKIGTASVEINGITVIAGENDTGKSTVGKALFSVFNSFYDIDELIRRERELSIKRLINAMYRTTTNVGGEKFALSEICQTIAADIELYKNNHRAIKQELSTLFMSDDMWFEEKVNDSDIDSTVERIIDILNVSSDDIFKSVLGKRLEAEFYGQVNNIYSEENGELRLQIKEREMLVTIKDNKITEVENRIDLHTEAVYLDDPFILDERRASRAASISAYVDHREHLKGKISSPIEETNIIDEIVAGNKIDSIYSKIESVCSGDIVNNRRGWSGFGYKDANTEKILDVRNLSTGLKTFVILKKLLLNGTIDYNGTIILDEPEIHLHPEWQLLFAELIVLIHKEFDTHILLNTHSPYFLNAIEVYSAKYGVAHRCKYYLASIEEGFSNIHDVSDNIEAIYSKLARPLQDLENARYQND